MILKWRTAFNGKVLNTRDVLMVEYEANGTLLKGNKVQCCMVDFV